MKNRHFPLKLASLCAALLALPLAVHAAPGDLDTTFGTNGIANTSLAPNTFALAVQSDGKIVVGGTTNDNFSLARYNTNGTLDTTFGTSGKVTTDFGGIDIINGLAIQSNGKIVAVGDSTNGGGFNDDHVAAARYNTNGTLDTTFAASGKFQIDINSTQSQARDVAIQADGNIVYVGFAKGSSGTVDFLVGRLLGSNGTSDANFSVDGIDIQDVGRNGSDIADSVVIQSDGKIVLAGSDELGTSGASGVRFALMRYNTNGTLDTSFGTSGKVTTNFSSGASGVPAKDYCQGVTLDGNGKIVAAGYQTPGDGTSYSGSYLAVARYNTNGSLDTTFGTGGKVTMPYSSSVGGAYDVSIQSNGKIVAAGVSYKRGSAGLETSFALVRFTSTGAFDTTFGTSGVVITGVALTNYNAFARRVRIQSDGKIVAAGNSYIVRYLGDTTSSTSAVTSTPSGGAS